MIAEAYNCYCCTVKMLSVIRIEEYSVIESLSLTHDFFQFQLFYCNPKTITIMQYNYISEKSGNNGQLKRDADPANWGPLPIKIRNRSTWLPCKNSKSLC